MASDSLKLPDTLMAMSNEILLEICKKLCPNYSNNPKTNLSNLSMTCGRLRAIVQPFLHHDASPRKMQKFLQTITENKHLAAQVHRFYNSGGEWYWCRENDGPDHEESTELTEYDMIYAHYRLLARTLAKLTKVKHLNINMPLYKGYPWKDALQVSVSMESVTHLSLKPWNGNDIDLGQTGALLAMMPCLESLEVARCTNVTKQLPLASLRSLTFGSSQMNEKSLRNIVDSCPKLEHFAFGFSWKCGVSRLENGSEPFTWSQAQRILYSRRTTLKHLRLEFNGTISSIMPQTIMQEEYFGSFRQFNTLESLWVLTAGFGSKDNGGTFPTFPENVQHLVSMLPKSLARICFRGNHLGWGGLRVLAQAIQKGHFPSLKRVMLEQDYADRSGDPEFIGLEDYQELFTTLGVCFEPLHCMEVDSRWKQYITTQYA